MALSPLAVVTDLPASVDVTNTAQVATSLAAASEAVRDAAGVPISQETSTVALMGTREQWLPLPGQPVVSVSSVVVDGIEVVDYVLREGRLWRLYGWQEGLVLDNPFDTPSEVVVTMVHGLLEVPADIVALVASLAAADLNASAEGYESKAGIASESIDDYRVAYTSGENVQAFTLELPDRTRAWLRQRFGGGSYVTGSR